MNNNNFPYDNLNWTMTTKGEELASFLGELHKAFTAEVEVLQKEALEINAQANVVKKLRNALDGLNTQQHDHDGMVFVNIGGLNMPIKRSLVVAHAGNNNLFKLLSGKYDHLISKDKEGRLFLDLDPRWIEPHFNWLKDITMWNGDEDKMPVFPSQVCSTMNEQFSTLNRYFSLNSQETSKPSVIKGASNIINELDIGSDHILSGMFGIDKETVCVDLLHRGSRDGFSSDALHKSYTDNPDTMLIIKDTKGNVFGAYTAGLKWRDGGVARASSSFLFMLHDATGTVKATKYAAKNNPGMVYVSGLFTRFGYDSADSGYSLGIGRSFDRDNAMNTCNANKFYVADDSSTLHSVIGNKFQVAEMELLSVAFKPKKHQQKKRKRESIVTSDSASVSDVSSVNHSTEDISGLIQNQRNKLARERADLLEQLLHLHNEVHFVARFVGLVTDAQFCQSCEFHDIAADVERLIPVLQTHMVASPSLLMNIAVGGRRVTVSKATLQQAPEGSPLANMASDAWGHDLDSDGNIYQDVNSELFVAIINHLRLKQLLSGTSTQVPPIMVYEEQKTALDNLLAFYMLTDLPIKTVK